MSGKEFPDLAREFPRVIESPIEEPLLGPQLLLKIENLL